MVVDAVVATAEVVLVLMLVLVLVLTAAELLVVEPELEPAEGNP